VRTASPAEMARLLGLKLVEETHAGARRPGRWRHPGTARRTNSLICRPSSTRSPPSMA
jgi:hypothetical protein